jgi:hypothetical protein
MAGGKASENGIGLRKDGVREAGPWSTEQYKEFAGPEQDIEQPTTLEIIEVLAVQSDVQSTAGAFFDEGPKGGQIERHTIRLLTAGIDTLQVLVAKVDEVIYAKNLLSQTSSRGPVTKIHSTDSVLTHRKYSPQFKARISSAAQSPSLRW